MTGARYAKAFFELQLAFARTVSDLSGVPYPRAVLDATNLYIRFALGRQPHETTPGWQDYVRGLAEAGDPGEWTYRFYLSRAHLDASPPVDAAVGCFAYALAGDRIRLHFQNAETDGVSPLASARCDRRRAELRALFAEVKRTAGTDARVVGASWLYNVQAYRRVFPPSYVATERVLHARWQRMPLWGQFLDRHGDVKEAMRRPFIERLARVTAIESLESCFPFPVLGVEAPVREFYAFYGV